MNRMAITISQYLYFNMTWLLQETFHIDRIITKAHFCITLCSLSRVQQGVYMFDATHTTTTSTSSSFDNARETDLFRFAECIVNGYGIVTARYSRYTRFIQGNNAISLVPHQANMSWTWT